MANMADAVWAKAAAFAACWFSVVALIVFIFGRAVAVSARRWRSTWSSSAGRLPPVGQQLLDPAVQLRRQASEDVLQVVGADADLSHCADFPVTRRVAW
jgi:hypothetical protein